MNIAMTGATGYIGKHLSSYLTEKGGHRVIPLGRSMFREGMSGLLIQTLAQNFRPADGKATRRTYQQALDTGI